jgi:hypothetical protein
VPSCEQLAAGYKRNRKLIHEMTNKDKRSMAYDYYATQVYDVHGAGKRVVMPPCVCKAVRAAWPEENPLNYVGHRDPRADEEAADAMEQQQDEPPSDDSEDESASDEGGSLSDDQ